MWTTGKVASLCVRYRGRQPVSVWATGSTSQPRSGLQRERSCVWTISIGSQPPVWLQRRVTSLRVGTGGGRQSRCGL